MKKKLLLLVIALVSALTCAIGFAACGEEKPSHSHRYSSWKNDEVCHWLECQNDGCDNRIVDKAEHFDADNDGICDICGYNAGGIAEHTHSLTYVPSKEASCIEDGNVAYYICSDCGKWFKDKNCGYEITDKKDVVIVKGHNLVSHSAKSATCTEVGWDEYTACTRCNYTTKTEIPALGHNAVSHSAKSATCTEVGWNEYTACTRCNYTTKTEIPALGHNAVSHSAKSATCTEVGWYEYTACTRCDYTTKTEIPALGHNAVSHSAKSATCTEVGWNEYTACTRCNYTTKTEIPALGHNAVSHSAKSATCTEVGWYEYTACTRCDYTTKTEIPALGHNAVSHSAKSATCTEVGWNEYTACTRCNYTTKTEIPALGHNAVSHSAKSATCTEVGWYEYTACTRCDYTTKTEIPALGHSMIFHEEHISTCWEDGNTAYYTCNNCGVWFKDENGKHVIIDKESVILLKIGHVFGNKNCVLCGIPKPTEGLEYTLNGYYYICKSIGTATETDIVIADLYNRKPVTSIYSGAFKNCSSLTSVIISGGVEQIGYNAFSGCSSLTSVTISDSVTNIWERAFDYCSSLTIYCEAAEKPSGWSNKWNYSNCPVVWNCKNNDKDENGYMYTVVDGIRYSLKDGIATVISQPKNITTADIPAKVTYKNIDYRVTSIVESAFSACNLLTSVTISDSVASIGSYAFNSCSSLTNVTIGNGVTSIGVGAISGCSSLTSIIIPDSVTSIGGGAFSGCNSLTSVTIGNGVTSIGDNSFNNCSLLSKIKYKGDIKSWCAIEGLNGLMVDGKVDRKLIIDDADISGELIIPDDVTSISSYAFYKCNALTSVIIHDSVTSIGSYAFSNCNVLTVYCEVKNEPAEWANGWCSCPVVWNCKENDKTADGYAYSIINGIRYSLKNSEATVVRQLNNIEIAIIPSLVAYKNAEYRVTSIGSYAFSGCSLLGSVFIPDSVTSIYSDAFYNCISLQNITVSDNNTEFKSFEGNLYSKDGKTLKQYAAGKTATDFTVPDEVTSIGDYAFNSCSSLTSITIPEGVTSIGYGAFRDCSSLTSVDIPDNMISIGNHAFDGCDKLIQTENGVNYVDKWVIGCDRSLTQVILRTDTKGIVAGAFSGRYSFTSIIIPSSIAKIPNSAFNGCNKLISITISNSVVSFGRQAFFNCSSLKDINFEGTKEEWEAIEKVSSWNSGTGNYTIHCTNGDISKS